MHDFDPKALPFVPHNRFSLDDTRRIASVFAKAPGVLRVETYGDVATSGLGGCIKLLIVVEDEGVFNQFVTCLICGQIDNFFEDERPTREMFCTAAVWSFFFDHMKDLHHDLLNDPSDPYDSVYLMVVPPDWRDRLEELASDLFQVKLKVMREIASQARPANLNA